KLNIKNHDGVSFEQAAQVFFDPFVQYLDASRNSEKRDGALGCDFDFRLLFVVHLEIEDEVHLLESLSNLSAYMGRMYARPNAVPRIAQAFASLNR
ncbi:MAG: BrnT family toxin, partial [Gallionella sp.]